MTQQSYKDDDTVGSPLNKSDAVTSSVGITPQSVLRKFRLGHEPYTGNAGSPQPSNTYNKLGYTHVIGRHGTPMGSAGQDIISKSAQSVSQKLFRDKISVNLKTNLHREYFLDPINSKAAKGLSIGTFDSTKGIFDPLTHLFVPAKFKQKYDENASALDRITKSYYLSTALLSYLYLKVPAGFNNDDLEGQQEVVSFAKETWNNGQKTNVILPTILDLSAENQTQEASDLVVLISGLGVSGSPDYDINSVIDHAIDKNNLGEPAAAGGFGDYFVKAKSDFALPIWKYDAGSDQDIQNIGWKTIADTTAKEDDLVDALLENSTIGNITNFGVPAWVKSLRIYPCPDKEIIVTNPFSDGGASQSPSFETYKSSDAKMEDVTSAALKLVVEPKFDDEGKTTQNLDRYVEIRYVTEFEIDEKQLILDLVGQGVASLGGTKEEYVDAGFNIGELLEKTHGNLYDDELKDLYESGDYNF